MVMGLLIKRASDRDCSNRLLAIRSTCLMLHSDKNHRVVLDVSESVRDSVRLESNFRQQAQPLGLGKQTLYVTVMTYRSALAFA